MDAMQHHGADGANAADVWRAAAVPCDADGDGGGFVNRIYVAHSYATIAVGLAPSDGNDADDRCCWCGGVVVDAMDADDVVAVVAVVWQTRNSRLVNVDRQGHRHIHLPSRVHLHFRRRRCQHRHRHWPQPLLLRLLQPPPQLIH